MTKVQMKKLILAELDRLWNQANDNIKSMQDNIGNPQVKEMCVKNAGFKLALEDVNQFIYNMR